MYSMRLCHCDAQKSPRGRTKSTKRQKIATTTDFTHASNFSPDRSLANPHLVLQLEAD